MHIRCMKIVATSILIICGFAAIWLCLGGQDGAPLGANAAEAKAPVTGSNAKHPTLVELFTSEGCSSCPPADRLLTSFKDERSSDVITLSYHVDYWDYLGWKDRFSSAEFTKRQEAYARQFKLSSTYTPQMVVNGSAEFVGSNRAKADETIAIAAGSSGSIVLSLNGSKLSADIKGIAANSDATVYLAVAESGLITKVGGGENSGAKLEHSSVVRRLIAVGTVNKGEEGMSLQFDLPKSPDWEPKNTKYVVFVQDNKSLKIRAAAAL